jgi:hypothetical protein
MQTIESTNPYLVRFNVHAKKDAARKTAIANSESLFAEILERDRFQASHFLRNMVKALEIHSWQNTLGEWQRYYAAKIILYVRRYRRLPKNLLAYLK